MDWYRRHAGGIVVNVRLTPKADRDSLAGVGVLSDGRSVLKARVRAVPADGEANAALVKLMAKSLGVPKSAVEIVSGAAQRQKQVRIAGDPGDLAKCIEGLVAK